MQNNKKKVSKFSTVMCDVKLWNNFKVPLQTDNFDQISRCILHPITAKVKYVSEFFLLCLIKY